MQGTEPAGEEGADADLEAQQIVEVGLSTLTVLALWTAAWPPS